MGCKWSFKLGREAVKSEDVNGIGVSGVNASFVMVMGNAKSEESAVNSLNASCSSDEAERRSAWAPLWALHSSYL